MAHSDRGHPSGSSSGPAVPIAIKKKRREGCLRRAFPEAPPPLTRMKKNQKEEEGDEKNSNVSAGPPDPRPPGRSGRPPPLSSTGNCDKRSRGSYFSSRDFVYRAECHSTSERGSRGEDETAVLCPTDLGSVGLLGLPDGRRRTPRTPYQVLPLRQARALSLCVFSPFPGLGALDLTVVVMFLMQSRPLQPRTSVPVRRPQSSLECGHILAHLFRPQGCSIHSLDRKSCLATQHHHVGGHSRACLWRRPVAHQD